MINLNILPNLLIGRAGQRPRSSKPTLVFVHGQEGFGDPHDYFLAAAADSTCWIDRAGGIHRFLSDLDIAWTEGDVTTPDLSNPVIRSYIAAGVTNFNDLGLSVELEGWNSEASALDPAHKKADGSPYTAADAHATPAQLASLTALILYWCSTWGIPVDRDHILGHYQVGPHKQCPGSMVNMDQVALAAMTQFQATKVPAPQPPKPSPPVYQSFPQTGHGLGHAFLDFFNAHGGVPIFGYPLTEEMQESGQRVQYLERARFEYHPELPVGQQVMLGRIGAELLALRQPTPVPPIPLVPPAVKP